MKNEHEKVSGIFRAARKLSGKTQVEVSKHLGVSQSCISKIEAGKLMPSVTEWFAFANYVGIKPEESYHYGYLDQARPVKLQGVYEKSIFKMPTKYTRHQTSKVRTATPFIQYFVNHYGKTKWENYLDREKVDSDFFLVYDEQLSPQFALDLAEKMIENGILKPNNLDSLVKTVKDPNTHGLLQNNYRNLHTNRELVVSFFNLIDRYEANFAYQLEEASAKNLILSIKPRDHMKEIDYRNETLGDFLCRYKKKYISEFSSISGDRPALIIEKECHFHGSDQCVYQVQLA